MRTLLFVGIIGVMAFTAEPAMARMGMFARGGGGGCGGGGASAGGCGGGASAGGCGGGGAVASRYNGGVVIVRQREAVVMRAANIECDCGALLARVPSTVNFSCPSCGAIFERSGLQARIVVPGKVRQLGLAPLQEESTTPEPRSTRLEAPK